MKTWALLSLLVIMTLALVGSTLFVTNLIFDSNKVDNNTYVTDDLIDTSLPVNSEVNDDKKLIQEPYNDETVSIHINYYDLKSDQIEQEKSIIVYENTYMPNTGILYGAEEKFNVLSAYEGEVTDIKTDEVFGTVIEIKHSNNLITKYSSLTSADVEVGDTVNVGEVIGTSGINKVVSLSQNMLLFEIIYNGEYVNPNNYFNKTIEELE